MTSSIGANKQPSGLQATGAVEGEIGIVEELLIEQETSQQNIQQEESESTAGGALVKFMKNTLEGQKTRIQIKAAAGESPLQEVVRKEEGEGGDFQENPDQQAAWKFQKKNPQIKANNLLELRATIKPGMPREEILGELLKLYPHQADLVVEALNFLIETTTDPKEKERVKSILSDFVQAHGDEIAKDTKIGAIALGAKVSDPATIRNLHQSMAHDNPRDFNQMYKELYSMYPQTKDLKEICLLLMRTAGEESKSRQIEPGKISNLVKFIRMVQAVLGPQKVFEKGMPLIAAEMRRHEIELPPELNPQTVTMAFMKLIMSDYPNASLVMQAVNKLIHN